ncbi:hypothetical protein [Ancylobacter sp. FA202]|uniref:alpha/beta hydrolase family protein n=1 Tax=Ancylobacter sp. FA202 TaxID=1111106 RepID=UPI0003793160|nr:hypothetical protein [Ancylobacter sp. FA202]
MMATKLGLLLTAVALSATVPHLATAEEMAGVRQIAAPSAERGVALNVTVWYPAGAGGEPVELGESPFFLGTPAQRDAPLAAGKFPLILLSHGIGLGGNPAAASWIATALAGHGFVVAAPAHPGNSGKNRSAAETMKIWLRPRDLTETLNTLEKDPTFAAHLDFAKVGVLGLSAGGGTALAIAGARVDPDRLAGYCDTDALNPSLCGWVRQSGVDLHAMDLQDAGRDNADSRVRFAMALDPAPVGVFDAASFRRISIPIDLVNLGKVGSIPHTADASGVAKAVPGARYALIEDASHFSMFAECKAGGAERAEAEDIGDPICADGVGRPRSALHRQMIDMVVAAFRRALQTGPDVPSGR